MTNYENLIYVLSDHSRNIYSLDITLTKGINNADEIIMVLNNSTKM